MTGYSFLAVFGGAGLGACLRWVLGAWLNPVFPTLPLGTLAANLLGGLLVGMATTFFTHFSTLPLEWRLLGITGFLGGLTTFSTFSSEVVAMITRHELVWALTAAAAHLGGSLLLTGLGVVLGHTLFARA